jgi:hypothetical protein
LDETPDLSMDEALAELPDFPAIDLSGAVIDEPDLGAALKENPMEEPSLDNFSIDLDLEESLVEEAAEESAALEPAEEESEPSMEIADLNTGDLLNADTEAILDAAALADPGEEEAPVDGTGAINLGDMGDIFEIEDSFARKSGETVPEEENFAQVIPEGFVVESEDSPTPLDDDIAAESAEAAVAISPEPEEPPGETEPAQPEKAGRSAASEAIPPGLKQELRTVLSYMDQLLEALPEDKIEEFAKSEYFDSYKKLFEELGLT